MDISITIALGGGSMGMMTNWLKITNKTARVGVTRASMMILMKTVRMRQHPYLQQLILVTAIHPGRAKAQRKTKRSEGKEYIQRKIIPQMMNDQKKITYIDYERTLMIVNIC